MFKSLIENSSRGTITYPKWPIIPLTPIFAYAVLAYAERFSHEIALVTPAFYVAWLLSAVIVVALICAVHWITVRFDAHYPWHVEVKRRLKKQFIGGFLIPVSIAFILATCYFGYFSINIFDTIWIKKYLPAVMVFLVIINLIFSFYGSFVEGKRKIAAVEGTLTVPAIMPVATLTAKKDLDRQQEPAAIDEIITDAAIAEPVMDAAWLDIACVFCCHKYYYSVDFEGNIDAWPHHIQDSERLLPASHFCLIDRSFLVNFAAIKNVETDGPKVTLIALLPQVVQGIVNTYRKAAVEDTQQPKAESTTLRNKAKAKKKLEPDEFVLSVSYHKKAGFFAAHKKFLDSLKSN